MAKKTDKINKNTEVFFSQLDHCDSKLEINQQPLIVKYDQIFPIIRKNKSGYRYLYFQPFYPFLNMKDKQRASLSKKVAKSLELQIPIIKQIKLGSLPDPNVKNRLEEKVQILSQQNLLSSIQKTKIDANRIHQQYKLLIQNVTNEQIRIFCKNISSIIQISDKDFSSVERITKSIETSTLFDSNFSYSSKYSIGIYVSYEQEWKHLGYTRGELIKSLELAPGETFTLEYHYWDKSIIKTEDELSTELDLKSSSTLTQRDTKQILDELTTNNQLHLNGREGGNIKIPDTPIGLDAGVDGGISTQLQPHVSNSINNMTESIVNISNDFKQNRKVRVEETRISGVENKQTRVVANTNRCHTLQFNYFEIISNYEILNRVADIRPCILLPYRVICDNKILTPETIDYYFILCNENVLKSTLLDKVFLPGFEAAKKIASFQKLKELFKDELNNSTSEQTSTSGVNWEEDFANYRKQIIDDYNEIKKSAKPFIDFSNSLDLSNTDDTQTKVIEFIIYLLDHPKESKHLLYLISLYMKPDVLNALQTLKESQGKEAPEKAMADFFAKINENDFQYLDPVSREISSFFQAFGVPNEAADLLAGIVEFFLSTEATAVAGAIIGTIIEPGIGTIIGAGIGAAVGLLLNTGGTLLVSFLKDDAGLHNDVQTAHSYFENTKLTPTGAVNENVSRNSKDNSTESQPKFLTDFVSITEISDDYMELDRLICHLKCNFEYYNQALWLSKDTDYRTQFLIKLGLINFVTNEVLGFSNGLVAFGIKDISFLKNIIDIKAFQSNLSKLKTEAKDITSKITIPTSSTILNSQLGVCDLCESYIDDSRNADIRQQNAKAALDEAEVEYKKSKTKFVEQETLRLEARLN